MKEFKISERLTMRNESITRYLNEVSNIPMLSSDEEHEVAVKAAKGDEAAINKLVISNLRFVVSVAKMYQGNSVTKFSDLINEGNAGLIEAARSFDPTTGFKFISYAVWYIRKDMLKYLTNYSRMIRVPLNKVQSLKKMGELELELMGKLNRNPTNDEVVEAYIEWHTTNKGGITKKTELMLARQADIGVTALEGSNDDADEFSAGPINVINGDTDGTDHLAVTNDTIKMLLPYINRLNHIDKEIILLKFGFKTQGESLSFIQIGEELGYTSERIRQRYRTAIRKIQSAIRNNKSTVSNFI
jgi:RNA polymerase primary sigma factor